MTFNAQPGPAPQNGAPRQNGPAGPSGPTNGAGHGFFESIRWSGWYRADSRIVGGVCSGLASRQGWDPLLVRGLTLIAMILISPMIAVYGVAWMLLPEQRDGRIHLEQLLQGRFDIAHLGGLVTVLAGLGVAFPFSVVLGSNSVFGFFFIGLLLIAAVVAAVVVAASRPRTPTPPYGAAARTGTGHQPPGQPFTAPGGPTSFGQASPQPAPFTAPADPAAPSWREAEYVQAAPQSFPPQTAPQWSSNHPQSAVWTAPIAPKPRTVSLRVNLVVTGLVILAMATTFYFMYTHGLHSSSLDRIVRDGLIGAGVCLLIAGLALVVSSLRDRSAGWLVLLTAIGMVMAVPVAMLGGVFQAGASDGYWSSGSYEVPTYTWAHDKVSSANGMADAVLDLTEAPEGTVKTITVDWSLWGTLDVWVRTNQPIRIVCKGELENLDSVALDGGQMDWVEDLRPCTGSDSDGEDIPTETATARSPEWSTTDGITVVIGEDTSLSELSVSEMATSAEYTWKDGTIDVNGKTTFTSIDLTEAPSGTSTTISLVGEYAQSVTVYVRPEQPVRIVCEADVDNLSSKVDSGEEELDWVSSLEPCATSSARASRPATAQSATWSESEGITLTLPEGMLVKSLDVIETSSAYVAPSADPTSTKDSSQSSSSDPNKE